MPPIPPMPPMPDISAMAGGSSAVVEVHSNLNGSNGTSVIHVSTDVNGVHEERTVSGTGDINIATSSPDGRAQARVEVRTTGTSTSSIRIYPRDPHATTTRERSPMASTTSPTSTPPLHVKGLGARITDRVFETLRGLFGWFK